MKILQLGLSALLVMTMSQVAFARDAYYLCKNQEVMVRVVPAQLRAEVIKLNGLPSYIMNCFEPNDGINMVSCEGAELRSFTLSLDGRNGLYVGGRRTTPLSCYLASGGYGQNRDIQSEALE